MALLGRLISTTNQQLNILALKSSSSLSQSQRGLAHWQTSDLGIGVFPLRLTL